MDVKLSQVKDARMIILLIDANEVIPTEKINIMLSQARYIYSNKK